MSGQRDEPIDKTAGGAWKVLRQSDGQTAKPSPRRERRDGVFLPGKVVDAKKIQIEIGVIEGEFNEPCCDDCPVDVLLRPDDVIHDDDSDLTAEVAAKAFRGAQIMYTLKLPSGAEMLSLVPSHHNHAIGEQIGIRLAADHVVAFRVE